MSKNSRLFFKVLLSVIGLIIILYIFAVSIRMNQIKQLEGEYIRLQDALILTQALDESYLSDSVYMELQQVINTNKDVSMTYEQFGQLLSLICTKQGNGIFKNTEGDIVTDIVEECRKEYKGTYKDEYYFLKMDWYSVYDRLLTYYDMNEMISKTNVTVLGIGEDVNNADGKVLEENWLLAEEGEFAYHSDAFLQNKYQVISVYQKENILLTVSDVISRGYSLHNIWIMEVQEKGLQVFRKGYEIFFPYEKAAADLREQVADIEFADGTLQSLEVKSEKISGKLLSIRDGIVEIEGSGKYPCEEEFIVYKLYGKLSEGEQKDLRIGYDFTDFVILDGKICAGLMIKDEAMENIRVVIKNTDAANAYHESVELTADTDFVISYGNYGEMQSKEMKAGEVVTFEPDSEYFIGDRVYIEPSALTGKIKLLSVKRAQGTPSYRGKMEIAKTSDGLVIVNELLLEEYLYSVVPSEMPASYPLEALKAQAICARTYAYRHMTRSGIAGFGAHVDDGAGFQVYNNIAENSQTTTAVKETSGQLIYYGDELCGSYYYSTSCGFGTDTNIWKSDSKEDTSYLGANRIGQGAETLTGKDLEKEDNFETFIEKAYSGDYESTEAWYRWNYEVSAVEGDKILSAMQKRYEANNKLVLTKNKNGDFESKAVASLGKIKDIYIAKRNPGGVADELIIEGTKNIFKIISEHNIRYVLNNGVSKVIRQDGSKVDSQTLLPSAYFVIDTSKEDGIVVGYTLTGGGFGHGVGMSQNGAKNMAKEGMNANDILTFFYKTCEVKNIYEI